jgi:hypothetical protein
MKIVVLIVRSLLGLVFFVFGHRKYFPGSLPQRLRRRRDSERLRVCPQSEAVLRTSDA